MKAWAGVGEAYAASYAALCAGTGERMRQLAGRAGGRNLLDVGSGDGTLAAAWKDAEWQVTAAEPEPTMRAAALRRHPDLTVVDAALPALGFGAHTFDVVVANFVLNHVADPRVAATELARVSSGLVLATTWVRSPTWLWTEVIDRAGQEPSAGERLPPDKDFERTTEGFGRMLQEADLPDVRVSELTWMWRAEPAALWASVEGGVAGAGAHYAAADPDERLAFRSAFDAVVHERAVGGVLPLEHRAAIAVSSGN